MLGGWISTMSEKAQGLVSAVVDLSNMAEAKRDWSAIRTFFRRAHQMDVDESEDRRVQPTTAELPEVARRMDRICAVLADEALEKSSSRRDFYNFVFHPTPGSADGATVFVHTCQFAKINVPMGSRATALRFLSGMLAAADGFVVKQKSNVGFHGSGDDAFYQGLRGIDENDCAPQEEYRDGAPTVDSLGEGRPLVHGDDVSTPLMDALSFCHRDLAARKARQISSTNQINSSSACNDGVFSVDTDCNSLGDYTWLTEQLAYAEIIAQLCHYVSHRSSLQHVFIQREAYRVSTEANQSQEVS